MSALGERLVKASDRLYDRMRDPAAFTAARAEATAPDFAALRGAKYCLLVTYRRSGDPVPTPVWFGLDAEGRLYVRTEGHGGKAKRIRANPRVKVAPATQRGKPTGPLAEGSARVLEPADEARAEAALKANYGLGRTLYEGLATPLGVPLVYLEVCPAPAPAPGVQMAESGEEGGGA
jgi:PPOX class probable F420-dependent enzyme